MALALQDTREDIFFQSLLVHAQDFVLALRMQKRHIAPKASAGASDQFCDGPTEEDPAQFRTLQACVFSKILL